MARGRRSSATQNPAGCGLLALILIIVFAIGKCSGSGDNPAVQDSPTGSPGAASGLTERRFVSSASLNCRSAGRVSAKVVSRFSFGDSVSVRQEKDGWSQIEEAGTPCWMASRYLSESYPVGSSQPRFSSPASRSVERPKAKKRLQCSAKRTCGEMNSCAEANFYLDECGVSRLDGDGDGVPCESICG